MQDISIEEILQKNRQKASFMWEIKRKYQENAGIKRMAKDYQSR